MAYKLTPYDRRVQAELIRQEREARYASRYPTYKKTGAATVAPVRDEKEKNGFVTALHTAGDIGANVGIGLGKGVEGIVDLFAGLGGAVAGIFSDDAENAVKDFVAKDWTGELYGNAWQEGLDQSALNGTKAGQIIEGVAQGVGQLLPAVLVTALTGGAAAPAALQAASTTLGLVTTIASAAGTGAEQAFQEGASYGKGMAYGAASGAIEGATEKLLPGLGGLYGKTLGKGAKTAVKVGKEVAEETAEAAVKSAAKKVGAEIADVGLKRAAKEALGEGVEEMISEAANPALKTIYKGKDALKEYSDEEFWGGVLEAGVVGMGTSAAYGGTVGRAMKTTGVYGDANSVLEHIGEQGKRIAKGDLSTEQEVQARENIKKDFALLEKRLTKVKPTVREHILKNPTLAAAFDTNGTLKQDFVAQMDADIAAATDMTYDRAHRSSTLSAEVIDGVVQKANAKGIGVRAFKGTLSESQSKKNAELRALMGSIGQKSGGKVKYFLAENVGENGFVDPTTGVVAIDVSTLESGSAAEQIVKGEIAAELWQQTAIHETGHATEGTASHIALVDHLASNDSVYTQAVADFIDRGYFGKNADAAEQKLKALLEKEKSGAELTESEQKDLNTARSEIAQIATENVLGNADFVKRLIKGEPSRAEQILNKIVQIKNALSGEKGAAANKELAFVRKAERLYLNAIAELGGTYHDGKIHLANREEDENAAETVDEKRKVGYNNSVKFSVKRARYIPYDKLKKGAENAIRSRLYELYRGVGNSIANAIAVEDGNTVYIVDSGKEKGKIRFGVKEEIEIVDEVLRAEYVRRKNDRAVSNGCVSDGLFGRFGTRYDYDRSGNLQQKSGTELSTDSRKPQDQQGGVLDGNGNRGVGGTRIDFSDAIDQSAGAFDSWAQAVSNDSAGEGRNLSDVENRRGEMGADDIHEGEQKRNRARDQGRSEQNYRIDSKEDDELIAKLKAMIDSPIAEVVIDDDIRNLDDSEELVKRLRAMIESENMAKQGQGTEIKFSRKSANRNHDKVYTKSDARKVLSDVLREQLVFGNEQAYGALYGKHYTEVVDKLWHVLNDAEPGERGGVALDMADYIIDNAAVESMDFSESAEALENAGLDYAVQESLTRVNEKNAQVSEENGGQGVDESREVRYNRKTTTADEKAGIEYLIHNFSGEVRYDPQVLPLSDQELAVISHAVKTGWGKLNTAKKYGRVYSANHYYPFVFNADGSITVIQQLHIDAEKKAIEITERVLDYDTSESRAIRNFGDWIELARDEQGRYNFDAGDGNGQFQVDGTFNPMVGSTRGSHDSRDFGRSSGDRADSQVKFNQDGSKATLTVDGETYNSIGKPTYFDDVEQKRRVVWRFGANSYYVVDASPDTALFYETAEAAINAENESLIARYAKQHGTTADFVKRRLDEDYEFLSKAREGKVRFSRKIIPIEAHEYRDLTDVSDVTGHQEVAGHLPQGSKIHEHKPSPSTRFTHRDVNDMLENIRRESLTFTLEDGTEINGKISRHDGWDLEKWLYDTLNTANLKDKRVLAARIADQILATVVTESDQPLRDALGEDVTALVREDLALSVAALLGDKQAQIENRRINAHFDTMRKIVTEMEDVEKGRFYSATIYDGNTLRAIPNMIRAALKTSRAFTGSIRNTLAKVKDWYCAEDNTMMYKPIPGEHNEGMTDGQIVFDKDIAAMLEELTTGTGKLSVQELEMVVNIAKHFQKLSERYQRVFINGKWVDAEQMAEEMVKVMQTAQKDQNWIVRGLLNKYMRQFGDPAALFRAMDAYDPNGFYTKMHEWMRNAAISMQSDELHALREYYEWHEKHKKWTKHLENDMVEFRGVKMTVGQLMTLYCNAKTEKSKQALADNGYKFTDKDGGVHRLKGIIYHQKGNSSVKHTREEVQRACKGVENDIWDMLTEEQREYVKLLENVLNTTCRKWKIDTDTLMKGFSRVHEKGYYFPTAHNGIAKTVDTTFYEGDRVGHLSLNKDVVEGARGELLIENIDDVVLRHVHNMSLYKNYAIVAENRSMLQNIDVGEVDAAGKRVKNVHQAVTIRTVNEEYGKNRGTDLMKLLDKMSNDLQGGRRAGQDEQSFLKDLVEQIRGNYARFQLGLNPKTLATQLSSLIAAGNILEYNCIVRGIKGFASKKTAQLVDKYCPLAELRNFDNSAALAAGVLETTGKVGDVLMKGIGFVDRRVICSLFYACQLQVQKDSKLELGTEENLKAAGELLTRVILETQQNSLVTEKSDAMRGGIFSRTFTMFTADGMKVIGRWFDSIGEWAVLSKRYKEAKTDAEKARLKKELKRARGQAIRSTSALAAQAVYMALISYLFRLLYDKDEEDAKGNILNAVWDFIGGIVGGLPLLRDMVSYFTEGYELDNFFLSTINDVLVATGDAFGVAKDAISGKDVSRQDVAGAVRKVVYSAGQVLGIPVRNGYNFVTGLTRRIVPTAGYTVDGLFTQKAYTSDLEKAIESGDENMIETIAGLMIDEKIGIEDAATRKTLQDLTGKGYKVLPRSVGDSVTVDGETVELTGAQQKKLREVYAIGQDAVADMVKLKQFAEADEKVQAAAIKFIYDVYWDLALEDALGVDLAEKNVLFAEAIDIEKLAVIIAMARSIEADKDKNGKAISGTKKRKLQTFVNSLRLSAAEKYMVMGYLGYSNVNGEGAVKAHISKLNLSKSEKEKLLGYSGYGA